MMKQLSISAALLVCTAAQAAGVSPKNLVGGWHCETRAEIAQGETETVYRADGTFQAKELVRIKAADGSEWAYAIEGDGTWSLNKQKLTETPQQASIERRYSDETSAALAASPELQAEETALFALLQQAVQDHTPQTYTVTRLDKQHFDVEQSDFRSRCVRK
ncbi:hypothetical protein L4G92_07565 [Neisseria sp. ZJ106]|uniref:Uncharacterized protein n=1 Tax=Neisseria lisongii TaxID=2912188 RepID=A0ABY7RLJ6_9NEIS|nr:hypothetical protein [Neisseria lisongii]MCF7521902.1 hypothetical protein [Neisseria lisongii]WCL71135.1 hypothetical protein PJU73_07260 [Neisseria lisongii]